MPDMQAVASSNIASVGYDEGTRELYVTFHSGATYVYEAVGREAYEDLLAAPSPGKYLGRWIKDHHTARKV